MKHLAFLVISCFAISALAQDKPAPAPEKPAVKEAEAPKPVAAKTPAAAPRKGNPARRSEDARHCLEKASNTEVIKCAEEYL